MRGWLGALLLCLTGGGCDRTAPSTDAPAPPVPVAEKKLDPLADQLTRVRAELAAKNPDLIADRVLLEPRDGVLALAELRDAGLRDISPLRGLPLEVLGLAGNPLVDLSPLQGMPLVELDLERTAVVDLSPLAGMPLRSLWLNETPISTLEPLRGAPLTQLSLLKTPVSDLKPLTGMPLESLWLNETLVTDLSPLARAPLVSLTLHKTPVRDLSIVRQWPTLQRLHLGESQVSDLRPLDGLRLTRLILTPAKITAGMDVVRRMETLNELDIEFRDPRPWSPEEFWQRYDAGELNPR